MTLVAVLNVVSTISDIACAGFAAWLLPAFVRVMASKPRFWDPMRAIALLLVSGRYGFTLDRWLFGAHREAQTHAELVGRLFAFGYAIATIALAVYVIRGYKAMADAPLD